MKYAGLTNYTCLNQFFEHLFQGQDAVFKGKSALQVCNVWRANWAVTTKFDGCALHKTACSHDNWVVVAWHIPRFGFYVAINWGNRLNCLAKTDKFVR